MAASTTSTHLGQEGVEAEDEVAVALEELLDLAYDALRVDRLGLELLHDFQERLIDGLVVLEAVLDVAQVRERVVCRQAASGREARIQGRLLWHQGAPGSGACRTGSKLAWALQGAGAERGHGRDTRAPNAVSSGLRTCTAARTWQRTRGQVGHGQFTGDLDRCMRKARARRTSSGRRPHHA